jgi:crossover junction endodeoxyribonuclease RuvC
MRVIGIDPGYDRLGLAIVEKDEKNNIHLISSTCLVSNPKEDFAQRLLGLGKELEKIFKQNPTTEVAMEEVFFSKNKNTALKVAEARGMITFLASSAGLTVFPHSPQAVKMAVTGYGSATKDQIMIMVSKLVNFNQKPKYDDEYDAVAVAIAHLYTPKGRS